MDPDGERTGSSSWAPERSSRRKEFIDDYNIWIGASHMTDWTWVNSGQLLSDTYAPWAVDEPSSSMGHVYMSHADDFLYAVQLGTATNKNYMCEAGQRSETFGIDKLLFDRDESQPLLWALGAPTNKTVSVEHTTNVAKLPNQDENVCLYELSVQ
ncbi:hypothetical protein LSH36_840g02009 [Paralvinella palmiformis]|uniref:Uncharacterized protein n=1 Tax=Paralvinella palmiformis TaxID=53620 RepID=A0AAD9MTD7_9ANNE|nr:hypothetical protein LSH36_840g02009 [Paralvinella palmiformis]